MATLNSLTAALEYFSLEARELYLCSEVPRLEKAPSPLGFLRDWVNPNLPVVIQNAFNHWPALKKWDNAYLRDKIGDKKVTVAVTPNGYADAVLEDKFVMPEEREMQFSEFLDILEGKRKDPAIFYVQKQNSNLTSELRELSEEAASDISWATEAFGKQPDAINFWMGDERAITSMHKDHYENLYCVIKGKKIFTLLPPSDLPLIPYRLYDPARYKVTDGGNFEIIEERESPKESLTSNKVPWIAIDPLNPDLKTYPQYAKAKPVTCIVNAGEMLYLPSLWFHHVQQSHGCIAINFWYDMEYDIKYNYFKFVEKVSEIVSESNCS
ncbi:bifunctional peptidase and (3S)-lysyl hydroxylase Jmjd7-like [Montipora foliosa]|uniref:bifunctional peptidase and (3S)-lysyl hydroxylase Jmjd7-like n=1 Tax=Montipora foliosa TaxID=591990 RepID=UPI0035F128ED